MRSRIHREVYVWFRDEDSEICCCEAVRHRILSLQFQYSGCASHRITHGVLRHEHRRTKPILDKIHKAHASYGERGGGD